VAQVLISVLVETMTIIFILFRVFPCVSWQFIKQRLTYAKSVAQCHAVNRNSAAGGGARAAALHIDSLITQLAFFSLIAL
jgi:hypothetical protein